MAINGGTPVRTKPFHQGKIYGEREKELLMEVLESKWWGGWFAPQLGKKCREFEQKFAEFQGAKHAITVMNGTMAIVVALRAIGIKAGDEVIVPATCSSAWITPIACTEVNAVPVFVDVEEKTRCINPDLIEDAITKRTKVIMPIHWGGIMANMDKIMDIAEKYDLIVIEDAAHAVGAKWRDKGAGTIGHLGIFSFQDLKLLTSGEGGAIVTNDDKLNEKCRSIINCGRVHGFKHLTEMQLGANFRMTEWQAAILIAQLERFPEQQKKRRENVNYLNEKLRDVKGIEPITGYPQATNEYYSYGLRYDKEEFSGVSIDKFVRALYAELGSGDKEAVVGRVIPFIGIETCRVHMKPFVDLGDEGFFTHACPEIRNRLHYSNVKCPVAEKRNVIRLDHRIFLGSKEDMDDIVTAIIKIQENAEELL